MNLFSKTYEGVKGLLSGMKLTFGYFARPSTVITQQYPENRKELKLAPRTRTRVVLLKEDNSDQYRCTACGLCVRACPNGSLEMQRGRDPVTNKARLEKMVYHFERCTVCGLCVDSCRSDGMGMSSEFESAVFDSAQLTVILNDQAPAPAQTPAATPPPPAPPKDPQKPA